MRHEPIREQTNFAETPMYKKSMQYDVRRMGRCTNTIHVIFYPPSARDYHGIPTRMSDLTVHPLFTVIAYTLHLRN